MADICTDVKQECINFFGWKPSEKTKKKWWCRGLIRLKYPGLKDAVKPNAHVCERFYWILVLIITSVIAILMTLHSSQEFKNNPVTILFKPSRLPIENVTFPQLTIGKQNNINDEFVKQVGWLQEEYKVTTTAVIKFNGMDMDRDQIKNFLILMKTFCQPWFRGSNWQPTDSPVEREDRLMLNFDIDEFRLTDFGKEETLVENLALKIIEGTPKCSEMMVACTFNSMPVDCSEVFQDTYTESGPACSFNAMPSTLLRRQDTVITMLEKIQRNIGETENNAWKSWNVHKSLQTNITRGGRKIGVPDFQEQEGQWFGFQFIIKYPERGAHCHQSDSNNYRLTVNFPLDEPNLRDHGRDIPPGYKAINVIKPSVIMAEEDSHSAPPEKRGCYFTTERKLAYYKNYTESNCWRECNVTATLDKCGCSRVYHPRNSTDRICSTRNDEICANGVESNTNGTRDCKCLPGCNEVMYEMTTTLIPYPTDELPELVQDFLQDDDTPTSIVITYMEVASVRVVTAKHRFDWVEQLGLHGGNWGLTSGLGLLDLGRLIFSAIYVLVITGLLSYVAKCCWCWSRPEEESHSKMNELYMTAMALPMGLAIPEAARMDQLSKFPKMPQIVKDYMEDFAKSKQPEEGESDADHENEVITQQPTSSSPERPSTAKSESKSRKLVRPKSARAIAKSKFPYWTVGNFLEWFPIRYGLKIKQSLADDFDDDKTGQCCCNSCFPCCHAKDEVIVPLAEVGTENEAIELVDQPIAGPSCIAVAPADASNAAPDPTEASQSDPEVLEEDDFEEMWRQL